MTSNECSPLLDTRSRTLLRSLISRYIESGEPVGSQTLARCANLDVSPATIRNILADLEEQGLLSTLHTSSGRVPTSKGYRFYVDTLLQLAPISDIEKYRVKSELQANPSTAGRLETASDLLSSLSQFVGVVSMPKRDLMAFKRIEFVSMEPTKVLAIVVFADHQVQNRVIDLPIPLDQDDLQEVTNFLNEELAGRSLAEIRRRMVDELRKAQDEMHNLMADSVKLAESALEMSNNDLLMKGQHHLMGPNGLTDVNRLRELFDAFANKQCILQLLERTEQAEGVQIFIGEECGVEPLHSVSMVSSPYHDVNGQVLGVLGVIGPRRMDYDRIVPVVQATADALTESLNLKSEI